MLDHIASLRKTMRPAEKRVAQVVLADPRCAIELSTAAIAARAEVSEPTIIRFCRVLGCSGFRDFKLKLAQELATRDFTGDLELQGSDRAESYTVKVMEAARTSLGRFLQHVDHQSIEQAVDVLLSAKRIIFFGIGASGPVVLDAAHKFLKLNTAVAAYTDEWSQRMAASSFSRDDVVVMISYTGRTIGVVNVARLAKETSAVVIAITKKGSPLAEMADHVIDVDAPEEKQSYLPRHSRLTHFAVMEVLAAGYTLRKGPEFRQHLVNIQEGLEDTRLPRKH